MLFVVSVGGFSSALCVCDSSEDSCVSTSASASAFVAFPSSSVAESRLASGPDTKWWWSTPASLIKLKTQYPVYAPTREVPQKWSAMSSPAEATAVMAAKRGNSPCACIKASATNTTPLIDMRIAEVMAGPRAAACTSGSGVKAPRMGSAASWSAPSATPANNPHTSMRSATIFASFLLSSGDRPGASARLRYCGTRMVAMVERASSEMPPSCQNCMLMVWAAAAVPVGSIVSAARATARKERLRPMLRS
mmetsp:Transcript_18438/g.60022  ORF Transcript_18438/g.60022 Transcript_18438/m.60022 type:complete len:250 (+) Transcript_18438:166-915(+)